MIAIPLDSQTSTTISELYGNAPYFALLSESGEVSVVENLECGNGPKSAEFLGGKGVTATLFYHMGEGVYKAFVKNSIAVYSVEKNSYTLEKIKAKMSEGSLAKLDESNYKTLLDPGSVGSCQCGCND